MRSRTKNSFAPSTLKELEKCARCGKCRSTCPVFAVVKDEAYVARGRISLADSLARAKIPATDEIRTIMSACLMCRRCSEICPSDVDVTGILQAARFCVAHEMDVSRLASLFFRHVLPRRRLFDAVIQLAAWGQKLVPGRRKGTLRHLPMLFKGGKWLPPIARVSALDAHRKPARVAGARMRVGIFVGCLTNYVYPHVVDIAVEQLKQACVEAVVPSSQVCCGTPVLAFGDREAAQTLARRNRECFEAAGCDYVIALCATCGRTLKQEYNRLLQTENHPLGSPVLDISEFLLRYAELDYEQLADSVTYHDPCHLRWGQKVAGEPRELLRRSCNFEEAPGEMTCCGQAGAFHVLFPELAEQIGRRKLESLATIEAKEVATGCPGCILQLNDLFARAGSDKKAVHIVEVLARSAKAAARGKQDQ